MAKTLWPVEADVLAFVASVAPPTGFDYDDAVQSAVERAESVTGRAPLLADADDSTNFYDPPEGLSGALLLPTDDFVSLTSVTVDWNGTSGSVLTSGADYRSYPARPPRGWPTEGLRFVRSACSGPLTVRVVGRRGSFVELPTELWEAVAKLAAAKAIRAGASVNGTVKTQKQGQREVEYAVPDTGVSPLADQYEREFLLTVGRFIKVPVDG